MRRTAPHSALRHPFTEVLGSRANVAVMRELCLHGGELQTADLKRRTGLTVNGARLALIGLVNAGIVEMVGGGRVNLYRVNSSHPLVGALRGLFEAERSRAASLPDAIRTATELPEVKAVWVYGSFARGEDRFDSDLDICAVLEEDSAGAVSDRLRAELGAVGRHFAVTTSLVTIGPEDVLRLAEGDPWWKTLVRDAMVIRGARPQELAAALKRGGEI